MFFSPQTALCCSISETKRKKYNKTNSCSISYNIKMTNNRHPERRNTSISQFVTLTSLTRINRITKSSTNNVLTTLRTFKFQPNVRHIWIGNWRASNLIYVSLDWRNNIKRVPKSGQRSKRPPFRGWFYWFCIIEVSIRLDFNSICSFCTVCIGI